MSSNSEKTSTAPRDQIPDGPIDDLSEIVTTDGLPGGPHTAPTPGRQFDLSVGATREYVAGSRLSWYLTMARALSWSLDDVTGDFGADLYLRMLRDPQVRSAVTVVKSSILETGVNLTPAIEDADQDGYGRAVELHDATEEMLSNLSLSLDDSLWDMSDAIALGNRMAEQVYTLDSTLSGRREYMLDKLAVRPMESVAFVVDAYMNVLGILARIPGQPFGVQQGMLLSDVAAAPNLLPRGKFAILSFRPQNDDPRGTSILRAAFAPWNAKQQILREWLKYLAQFASPSLIGYTAEHAETSVALNPDGSVMLDKSGNPVITTPEQVMLAALQGFANGTATVFPNGARVEPIMMTGAGEAFLSAIDYYDRQIVKAILNQTLATEEGQHQTRAASGTHKDILDTFIRQSKRPIERMIERDVLRVWAQLNGWQNDLDLLPSVSLGTTENEDLPAMWAAVAQLQRAGYLHDSQYPELDDMLSLPERSLDETTPPVQETITVTEQGPAAPATGAAPAGPLGQPNTDTDTHTDTTTPTTTAGQSG